MCTYNITFQKIYLFFTLQKLPTVTVLRVENSMAHFPTGNGKREISGQENFPGKKLTGKRENIGM